MHQKLKEIIEQKRKEVAILRREGIPEVETEIPASRDFKKAISTPGRINLISEIKFASPSAGTIRDKCDPVEIGTIYEQAGASAISFLTDRVFFSGEIKNLPIVKKAVSIPVLRKDFIVDEIQIREAVAYALTEVHDKKDIEMALECGAGIIGINNRDLDTFCVDINMTGELSKYIPESCILVSESGILTGDHIKSLKGKGINAVLVGSALMASGDIKGKVKELVEAGKYD